MVLQGFCKLVQFKSNISLDRYLSLRAAVIADHRSDQAREQVPYLPQFQSSPLQAAPTHCGFAILWASFQELFLRCWIILPSVSQATDHGVTAHHEGGSGLVEIWR